MPFIEVPHNGFFQLTAAPSSVTYQNNDGSNKCLLVRFSPTWISQLSPPTKITGDRVFKGLFRSRIRALIWAWLVAARDFSLRTSRVLCHSTFLVCLSFGIHYFDKVLGRLNCLHGLPGDIRVCLFV